MAWDKVKVKTGMQGHNTERWNYRAHVKLAAKKRRRSQDKEAIREAG